MRIACVSDVCLGYGSPQIGHLVTSLRNHYGGDTLVVEPNRPALPPRHQLFPELNIRRAANVFDPYSESGRIEYLVEAARIIEEYSPDLLVICCTFCLPVLFKIRRPPFVLYYSYESIAHYGPFDVEMNRWLRGRIDLVAFPEENRAVREVRRFGFGDIPKVVIYNCPDASCAEPLPRASRNGKILYAGTIDPKETLAEYYTLPQMQAYPIDLYGPIRTASDHERRNFIASLGGHIRYCGQLDSRMLEQLRPRYIYSLVLWNPSSENQLFAAPNKFFESIADGVPPIATPHPQCKLLTGRYGCGLLTPDWTVAGVLSTLEKALRLHQTDEWLRMVENCRRAFCRELNWQAQFEKLRVHLQK